MVAFEISFPWMRLAEKILNEGRLGFDGEPIKELLNETVMIENRSVKQNFCLEEDSFLECNADPKMVDWMRSNFFSTVPVLDWGYSYGQRIIPKMEQMLTKLKVNPLSKSASFSLLGCGDDSIHVPCVVSFDFKIRDGCLYFNVHLRSQDIGKKAYADYVCFVEMARKLCKELGLSNYKIAVWINSTHIYKSDWEKISSLVKKFFKIGASYSSQKDKWDNLARNGQWKRILGDKNSYVNIDNAYTEFRRVLESEIKRLKPVSKVLDLGCGTADLWNVFSGSVPEQNRYGVDFAPEMIKIAKKRFPKSQFYVEDVRDFTNPGEKFSLIFSRGVLVNHLGKEYWTDVMNQYYALLERGGRFIFDYLNRSWTEKRTDVHQPKKILYSKETINEMIKSTEFCNSSFEIIGVERRSPVAVVRK